MSSSQTGLDEQTTAFFSELGLNEYETRAYLSILEGGVLVAREVSDRSSIPYAKVYQTLNSLVNKQLIVGDEGRPKKFRCRNPKKAIPDRIAYLDQQWQKEQEKRRKLMNQVMPELEDLFDQSDVNIEQEQGVWNITGLKNIQSRLSSLIELSEERIIIRTGDFDFFLSNLSQSFDDIDQSLIIITNDKVSNTSQFEKVIKIDRELGTGVEIYFDEFAMITIIEVNKGKFSSGEYSAVLTQIKEIVKSNLTNIEATVGDLS